MWQTHNTYLILLYTDFNRLIKCKWQRKYLQTDWKQESVSPSETFFCLFVCLLQLNGKKSRTMREETMLWAHHGVLRFPKMVVDLYLMGCEWVTSSLENFTWEYIYLMFFWGEFCSFYFGCLLVTCTLNCPWSHQSTFIIANILCSHVFIEPLLMFCVRIKKALYTFLSGCRHNYS